MFCSCGVNEQSVGRRKFYVMQQISHFPNAVILHDWTNGPGQRQALPRP